MTVDPFRPTLEALDRAHAIAAEYVAGLGERPVALPVTPEEMAEALDEPLPESGCDPGDAVEEWFERAERGIVASSGPRMFGWVIGGTTPASLAGDWLASALDQTPAMWADSPAAVQTEQVVLRWLKELFGLPSEWAGAITSGATMSNLVGLAAARQWAGSQLGFDPAADGLGGRPAIPIVSSTEIHASALKALGTLGLGRESVRKVPTPGAAIDLDALRAELATIDGPVIVVANAGEVNTGVFDDLESVAAICRDHPGGVWLHVDGAFGLFAAASPKYAHLVNGIERADSVAADAHKWLNVPYDAGFAFVRDVDTLRAAFAASAAYLGERAVWDPMSHLPEMSRRFRGLAAWCSLKSLGRSGYREIIERNCAQASQFGLWADESPGMELMAPTPLNIVCFRYVPAGLTFEETDAFNQCAVQAIQNGGKAFVTPTNWRGRAAIRVAFDNWATDERDLAMLKETVLEQGGKNSSAEN